MNVHFGIGRLTNSLFVMGIYLEVQPGNVFLSFITQFLQPSVRGGVSLSPQYRFLTTVGLCMKVIEKTTF